MIYVFTLKKQNENSWEDVSIVSDPLQLTSNISRPKTDNSKSYVGCLMASRISNSVEEEERERAPAADCPLWTDHWSVLNHFLLFRQIIMNQAISNSHWATQKTHKQTLRQNLIIIRQNKFSLSVYLIVNFKHLMS